jgi:hypothetical protein
VIETRQHEVICPHCQCLNRGQLPEGLEADRYFGPRLEAAAVFSAVYHQIVPRRNTAVIEGLMGQSCAEVWACDCFGAQLNAPAREFQLCLQHQLRDLQRVLDQQTNSP